MSEESLRELVSESTSYNELTIRVYGYCNSKATLKLKEKIQDLSLSTLHFDGGKSKRITCARVEKVCPTCGSDFEAILYTGKDEQRFCSKTCANKQNVFRSESQREKIRRSLLEFHRERDISCGIHRESRGECRTVKCKNCEKLFLYKINKQFCSRSCVTTYYWKTEEYRNKILGSIKNKVDNGTHSGWKSREGKLPSYAERFFIKVLNNNGIDFTREFRVDKYFVDFAIQIGDVKIALEIDGKQHELPDRKESDSKKDETLLSCGWTVYRIKWKNPKWHKDYIKEEITKFISFVTHKRGPTLEIV